MRKIIFLLLALFIITSVHATDETRRRRPRSNGDQTLSMSKKQKRTNMKIRKRGFTKKRQ